MILFWGADKKNFVRLPVSFWCPMLPELLMRISMIWPYKNNKGINGIPALDDYSDKSV
jgi:hypothetical protein